MQVTFLSSYHFSATFALGPLLNCTDMEKYKFIAEYELRASPKVLFPYISTASGLSQWFATKVSVRPDHTYDFYWDNESHLAKQVSVRQNKSVRFDFLNGADSADHNYIDFRVDVSELTQSTFLRVTDYSSVGDADELKSLWSGLIEKLKEIVGS